MYNVFDSFLARSTWNSGHDLDLAEFNKALSRVVGDDGFNADNMGGYFKSVVGAAHLDAIDVLVDKAWAVHDYLAVAGT